MSGHQPVPAQVAKQHAQATLGRTESAPCLGPVQNGDLGGKNVAVGNEQQRAHSARGLRAVGM